MKFVQIISDGSKKGIVVGILHLVIICLAYSSPFWLEYRWVAIGVLLLFAEQIVLGNCVLNKSQYGDAEGMFYENLLTHFGVKYDQKALRVWLRWIIPVIVLACAFVIQRAGLNPVVGF